MLSQRQADALRAIGWFSRTYGYPPTVREVADAIGHASTSSTHRTLAQLKAEGLVWWNPGQARTLRVLDVAPPF